MGSVSARVRGTAGRHAGCVLRAGSMRTLVERLLREDAGQDLAEYGIALAVVGLVAASAAVTISSDVRSLWQHALQVVVVATLRG